MASYALPHPFKENGHGVAENRKYVYAEIMSLDN